MIFLKVVFLVVRFKQQNIEKVSYTESLLPILVLDTQHHQLLQFLEEIQDWEQSQRLENGREDDRAALLAATLEKLQPLANRLEAAIAQETTLSPVSKAFVKLSTRSPKDSKKALMRAAEAYYERVAAEIPEENKSCDDDLIYNQKWRILCETTTQSCAVTNASHAIALLLDSARVFEDLEYALRGPPVDESLTSIIGNSARATREWNMKLVARAWDPRLKPESEFRGICWNGELTCLCQYFHPLYFDEISKRKGLIESDIRAAFEQPDVRHAVRQLGGHCIIDFAWLAPGDVLIVELNPFDGVCLGTFPASTGLFLWENEEDQAIMRGNAPFEFRIRTEPLKISAIKAQCNPSWRDIISREPKAAPFASKESSDRNSSS